MKRTRPLLLVVCGITALVAGLLIELVLASAGRPLFIPPATLPVTMLVVAALVVIVAVPIRRAISGASRARVNPFHAIRVAVLAKASSLTGVLITGAGAGIVLYLVSRSVIPDGGSIVLSVATVVGGGILTAAGLVAEHLCAIPPDHNGSHDTRHDHDRPDRNNSRDTRNSHGRPRNNEQHRGGHI